MMITSEELDLLLQKGEGYKLEFKENINTDLPKELVAFANSSGGRILVGITDSKKKKGLKITNALLSKIQDHARQCDPSIDIEIESQNNFLTIFVKEGLNKPYRCTKGFYIRNGANSQKLSTQEIIRFVQSEGKTRFDEVLRADVNFDKVFDQDLLNRFLQIANISKSIDDTSILRNLSILEVRDNQPVFNNAGLLFFSRNIPHHLYHATIVCALYKGTEKVDILDRKEFSGDLISNIEDTLAFLKKHLNLRIEIKALRHDKILEIPEMALREAVVNAVCHRDYFEKGANTMVEIYDDRVEITNPGGLPKTLDSKDFGKKSVCRNPLVATLLLRSEYIEKMGTGINRIKKFLKEANCPAPKFEFDSFFTLTFERIGLHLPEAKIVEATQETTQETTPEIILGLIRDNPEITRNRLSDIIGITPDGVKYHLDNMRKLNLIRHQGSTKKGKWVIINENKLL